MPQLTEPKKRKEIGQLVIVCLKARNLPDKHNYSKQDPYCVVQLTEGERKATKAHKGGGQTPCWEEEQFVVPLFEVEGEQQKLTVQVWANEPVKDIIIGEGSVVLTPSSWEKGKDNGGEFDEWVPLGMKGKYAGEAFLEMTFYPPERPPPKSSPPPPAAPAPIPQKTSQVAPQSPSSVRPPQQFSKPRPQSMAAVPGHLNPQGNIKRRPSKFVPNSKMLRADALLPGGPQLKVSPLAYQHATPLEPGQMPFPGDPEVSSPPTALLPGGRPLSMMSGRVASSTSELNTQFAQSYLLEQPPVPSRPHMTATPIPTLLTQAARPEWQSGPTSPIGGGGATNHWGPVTGQQNYPQSPPHHQQNVNMQQAYPQPPAPPLHHQNAYPQPPPPKFYSQPSYTQASYSPSNLPQLHQSHSFDHASPDLQQQFSVHQYHQPAEQSPPTAQHHQPQFSETSPPFQHSQFTEHVQSPPLNQHWQSGPSPSPSPSGYSASTVSYGTAPYPTIAVQTSVPPIRTAPSAPAPVGQFHHSASLSSAPAPAVSPVYYATATPVPIPEPVPAQESSLSWLDSSKPYLTYPQRQALARQKAASAVTVGQQQQQPYPAVPPRPASAYEMPGSYHPQSQSQSHAMDDVTPTRPPLPSLHHSSHGSPPPPSSTPNFQQQQGIGPAPGYVSSHQSPSSSASTSQGPDVSQTQAQYYAHFQLTRDDARVAAELAAEEDQRRKEYNSSRLEMEKLSEQKARDMMESEETERRWREEEDERVARALAQMEEDQAGGVHLAGGDTVLPLRK